MASSNFPNRPFRLEETTWLLRQDVGGNYSVVRGQLWIRKNAYSPTYSGNTSTYAFHINGAQVAGGSFTFDFRNSDALLLAQVDVVIPHNADGTMPSVIVVGACNAALLGYTEVHGSIGLPTIPRASGFEILPSMHDNRPDRATTIRISRASTNFTHIIRASFGSWSATIAQNVATQHDWTPPYELLEQIPDSDTGVGTLWVDTYSGGTLLGSASSPWRLNAPASVVPTVAQLAAAELNPDVASIVGKFVQGLSRAKLTVTGQGAYGSTIKSTEATLLGSTVASGGDIALTQAGALPVTGKVTDSRWRVGTATGTVDVLAYAPPSVSAYQARRCNSTGAVQDDGAYLRVDLTAAISSLVNVTQRNELTVRAFTRPRGTTAWTPRNVVTPAGMTYNSSFVVSGGAIFATTSSWEVRVEVSDKFGKYIADTTVSTISVTMDLNGKTVGIGKIWENGALDVAGDTHTSGEFRHRGGYPVEPVGVIVEFGGATAPAGWLLCDGSAVSRTTHAALFAVIGTAYGAGNGTSTFNLPNRKGRVAVGRDAAQPEFDALGKTGGAKTHTLTVAEIPPHSHNIRSDIAGYPGGASSSHHLGTNNPSHPGPGQFGTSNDGGGGGAHNNLQPYIVTNFIIKAL